MKREMIVVQLSYNFCTTLTTFFFLWSTIGSVFLYIGLKYLMVDLKKKLLESYKKCARNITLIKILMGVESHILNYYLLRKTELYKRL
jgi:hypothetical protein